MKHFETRDALEAEAYRMTMTGQPCHLEWRGNSPVIVSDDRVVGEMVQG